MSASAPVRSGLDRLRAGEGPPLGGVPIALLCHPASVAADLIHVSDVLRGPIGAEIVATVRRGAPGSGVSFAAGPGVGTVTKPGLPIPPGMKLPF